MDYGTGALNTLLTNLYNPDGEIDVYNPWFLTSLIAAIDDDVEDDSGDVRKDYYIHRFRVEFRILDPDENYLTRGIYSIMDTATSAEADPDPSNANEQVARLAILLVALIPDYYIDFGAIAGYIYYLTGGDTLTDSTLVDSLQEDYFYVEWTVGIHNYGSVFPPFDNEGGIAPRQKLKDISLWTQWDLNLQNDYGDYQIEIKWEVDVRESVRTRVYTTIGGWIPWWYHIYEINPAFILTGSQYINFGYIE